MSEATAIRLPCIAQSTECTFLARLMCRGQSTHLKAHQRDEQPMCLQLWIASAEKKHEVLSQGTSSHYCALASSLHLERSHVTLRLTGKDSFYEEIHAASSSIKRTKTLLGFAPDQNIVLFNLLTVTLSITLPKNNSVSSQLF